MKTPQIAALPGMTPLGVSPVLSEDEIERRVERLTDKWDRIFIAGYISEAQYRAELNLVNCWATRQYANAERARERSR